MKAQISFVEFLTAMLVFISFVGYFSLQILSFIPSYMNEIKLERLQSEAFQVSELLINDPNWLSDSTQNKTNLLSASKIGNFNCVSAKETMGLDYEFSLILNDTSTNPPITLKNCATTTTMFRQLKTTITRIVAFNDNGVIKPGKMILQMW
jgi:hypothetical protein